MLDVFVCDGGESVWVTQRMDLWTVVGGLSLAKRWLYSDRPLLSLSLLHTVCKHLTQNVDHLILHKTKICMCVFAHNSFQDQTMSYGWCSAVWMPDENFSSAGLHSHTYEGQDVRLPQGAEPRSTRCREEGDEDHLVSHLCSSFHLNTLCPDSL